MLEPVTVCDAWQVAERLGDPERCVRRLAAEILTNLGPEALSIHACAIVSQLAHDAGEAYPPWKRNGSRPLPGTAGLCMALGWLWLALSWF